MKTPKEVYKELKANREAAKITKQIEKEKSVVRKPEDLQSEYQKLCQIVGDKQYRAKCLEAEVAAINEKIFKLNQEFDKSRAVHAQAAPISHQVPVTSPDNKVESSEASL